VGEVEGYEVDATCPKCQRVEWRKPGWIVVLGRDGPMAHDDPNGTNDADWTCNVCEHHVWRPSPKADLLDMLVVTAVSRGRSGESP
jgi:hypothetical protein